MRNNQNKIGNEMETFITLTKFNIRLGREEGNPLLKMTT